MAFPSSVRCLATIWCGNCAATFSTGKSTRSLKLALRREELEEAVAWASGEDDIMGEERKQLSGRVGDIYDILTADEEPTSGRSVASVFHRFGHGQGCT